MITNRNVDGNQLGDRRAALRYFSANKATPRSLADWTELQPAQFRDEILDIVNEFPLFEESENEKQKHLSFFIHGYNNDWQAAVQRYQKIQKSLYDGAQGLGQLILFTWPSNGHTYDYLSDREDARASAPDLAQVFVNLHDYVVTAQRAAAISGKDCPCRAKISIIAHSMGNFVLQKALAVASKMLNNPQLITLIHQSAMVAADVDNDLFQLEQPQDSDGSLMANLCYRIGALYTGRDEVLGASAGLKHFGKRRLGRSGLAAPADVYDNVFDLDVTTLLPKTASNIHSAVFEYASTLKLLRSVLTGRDRSLVASEFGIDIGI
jgi:esterase/lipase superfamily enzyme